MWGSTFFPLSLKTDLVNLLPLILILIESGTFTSPVSSRGNDKPLWCCYGWSDDLSASTAKSPQVDTKQCTGPCRGDTFCTDSSNKDCATNWYCDRYASLVNKTDDDCLKPNPGPGKTCFCDTDWCNCPQSLKGKKTPLHDTLKCCSGIPKYAKVEECRNPRFDCLGWYTLLNTTDYGCLDSETQRLRDDCSKFSFKTYGYVNYRGSDCRCTTDYCNCPADKKPGGAAAVLMLNFNAQLFFLFQFLVNFFVGEPLKI